MPRRSAVGPPAPRQRDRRADFLSQVLLELASVVQRRGPLARCVQREHEPCSRSAAERLGRSQSAPPLDRVVKLATLSRCDGQPLERPREVASEWRPLARGPALELIDAAQIEAVQKRTGVQRCCRSVVNAPNRITKVFNVAGDHVTIQAKRLRRREQGCVS